MLPASNRGPPAVSSPRMGEGPAAGAIDPTVTDRIGRRLDGNPRFESVAVQPSAAPTSIVAAYDLGYVPAAVSRAYLQIRWYETDDFSVQYAEQYGDSAWECRWDRHPNAHNTRSHLHPPPDASTPGKIPSSRWSGVMCLGPCSVCSMIESRRFGTSSGDAFCTHAGRY